MRPHEFVRLKENGRFTMEDLWRSSRARALRNSRTTVTGREIYLGPRGEYGNAEYFHLNLPSRQLGFSWSVLKCFENAKRETLFVWWIAREIALSMLTLMLFGTLFRFLYKLFFMIQLKKLGTTTRFALRPFNPFYEYNKYLAEVKSLKGVHAEEEQSNIDENAV